MSTLIVIHVATGLVGIASGLVVLAGTFFRRRMARSGALFLMTTGAACATGFVFLPSSGITSAQIVAFFSASLLATAAYARYIRRLEGNWIQVDVIAVAGALFLNVLIATAQSFQHVHQLMAIAPTQRSPVYVAIKVALLLTFIAIALVMAKRVGPRQPS